jgi:Uma2 family endonuclease
MSTALVLDRDFSRQLIRERQKRGIDLFDEVWDGVYVMSPLASLEHQDLVLAFAGIFQEVVMKPGLGRVHPGANVSDRRANWKRNYRVPDVVVVLNDGRAIDCGTHWFGGPDFLVEIESPDDDITKKIPFYSKIGVRELLIVDRDIRALRLFRLTEGQFILVGQSGPKQAAWLESQALPLAFRWRANRSKPHVEVKRTAGRAGQWLV